jgi:hypothetical protein
LWTVALVAPGGFLLVPVLVAASVHSDRPLTLRERFALLVSRAREGVARLQRYWTKS